MVRLPPKQGLDGAPHLMSPHIHIAAGIIDVASSQLAWGLPLCPLSPPISVNKYAVFSGLGHRNRGKIVKTSRLLAESRKQRGYGAFWPFIGRFAQISAAAWEFGRRWRRRKSPASAGEFSSSR